MRDKAPNPEPPNKYLIIYALTSILGVLVIGLASIANPTTWYGQSGSLLVSVYVISLAMGGLLAWVFSRGRGYYSRLERLIFWAGIGLFSILLIQILVSHPPFRLIPILLVSLVGLGLGAYINRYRKV